MDISKTFIKQLGLAPHPEGGFYAVTYVDKSSVASPVAADKGQRPLASVIYYLLAPQEVSVKSLGFQGIPKGHRSHAGYFHTNKSTTCHTWHSGRAVYTLIKRSSEDDKDDTEPIQKQVVIGPNIEAGETMQLIVPGGWWKKSETDSHCLISECVTPAWVPEDHTWMKQEDLDELAKRHNLSGDEVAALREHLLP